ADTPLMQQYREMKKKHPDAILLFRVGDFYECTEVVPGSDYMPIDVAYELLQSDIAFHLQELKEGLAERDEDRLNELNQRQLSALLLIRFQWGHLGGSVLDLVLNDSGKEEWMSCFQERDGGDISKRHRAVIEIYFGADYADFYDENFIVVH
ncbi:MAG: hypothetical protein HFK02_05665, partial [Clostridia bacterium]|nr:hypothetical protein [Clostridia bacterium]